MLRPDDFKPKDAITEGPGIRFDPNQHDLRDDNTIPWLVAFQNKTGRRDLHVYRHRRWGSWVLFAWWKKPGDGHPGVMVEIEIFPDKPGNVPVDDDDIQDKLSFMVMSVKHMQKQLDDSDRNEAAFKAAAAEIRADKCNFLRKKGYEELADDIELGREGGEWFPSELAGDIFRDGLKPASPSKIIVG
jgi:hypothetical protein